MFSWNSFQIFSLGYYYYYYYYYYYTVRIVIFRAFETGVYIFFYVPSRVCAFLVCEIF